MTLQQKVAKLLTKAANEGWQIPKTAEAAITLISDFQFNKSWQESVAWDKAARLRQGKNEDDGQAHHCSI